jgi:hypothetical protein
VDLMGYRVITRHAIVRLRGTEFDGVEVTAEVPPSGELAEAWTKGDVAMSALLGRNLVGWTLETEDGDPIAPTAEALAALPSDLVTSIVLGYWKACTRAQRDSPTPPADDHRGASTGTEIAAL